MNLILRRPVIIGAAIGAAGLAAVILALSLSGGSDPTAGETTAGATTTSSPAAQRRAGLAQPRSVLPQSRLLDRRPDRER
jgi:ABC-type hemin transport system ATPase subunit